MCLLINGFVHTEMKDNHYLPLVADRDIRVLKFVYYDYSARCYVTPYMDWPVKFVDGKCEMVSDIPWDNLDGIGSKYAIYHGIHAYTTEDDFYDENKGYILFGIIPEGTRYYIGFGNEIVAERMIIFENSEDPGAYGTVFV